MAESLSVRPSYALCPVCNVPFLGPSELVALVEYPADVEEIDKLLRRQLNSVHHICGEWIGFPAFLVVADPESARAVATEEFPVDEEVGLDLTVADNYEGVLDVVSRWISQDAALVLAPTPETARTYKLRNREFLDAVTPMTLLAAKHHRDGVIELQRWAKNGDVAAAEKAVRDMGVDFTVRAIKQVVSALGHEDRIYDILAEMRTRVPRQVIDGSVLEQLVETAGRNMLDASLNPMARYQSGLAVAVAHAQAGVPSPLAVDFVEFLFALWEVGVRKDVYVDERVWLTPEIMRQIVDPQALVSVVVRRLSQGFTSASSQVNPIFEMAAALGHEEVVSQTLAEGLKVQFDEPSGQQVRKLMDVVLSQMEAAAIPEDDDPGSWGAMLGMLVWRLVESLPTDLAVNVYEEGRSFGATRGVVELYAMDATVCQLAGRSFRMDLALHAGSQVLDAWGATEIPPTLAHFGLNEVGNVFRYTGRYEEALGCYEIVEELNETFIQNEQDRIGVLRNRAIVLRDMGEYDEALSLFHHLLREAPDRTDTVESLAVLHIRVGDYAAAVSIVNEQLSRPGVVPDVRRRLGRVRGIAHALAGQADEAIADLTAELQAEPVGSMRRLETLGMLVRTDPKAAEAQAFVEECAAELRDSIESAREVNRSAALTAAAALGLRRVRQGDRAALADALELCDDILEGQVSRRWQVELLRASHLAEVNPVRAGEAIRDAATMLDEAVPSGQSADFALTWIGDSDIQLLQAVAVKLAVSAADGVAVPDDLVAAFDLQNGRELTSVAARRSSLPALAELTSRLDVVQSRLDTDVAAVLDTAEESLLLTIPVTGEPELVSLGSREDIERAVSSATMMALANPRAPERLNRALTPWWEFAARFVAHLRSGLPSMRPLTILTGSRLLSTPLHAAGWPDDPLIFGRPVSYAVNFRLLVGDAPDHDSHDKRTALICPKRGDSPAFIDRLGVAARVFHSDGFKTVSGVEVDADRLRSAVEDSRELVILCHGVATAGPDEGPGICVAASGQLPPSTMLVELDSDLRAFAVTWSDLMAVETTPELVVSLACSSGRTTAGRGGTRIGLDQALVGKTTTCLVSPLWNVAQFSALEWVTQFHKARADAPFDRAHRTATLSVAGDHPHPYHWAPFALSQHHRGDHQDG